MTDIVEELRRPMDQISRKILDDAISEIETLRAALDEAQLRSIEARNPGIDMEAVKRMRREGSWTGRYTVQDAEDDGDMG